MGGPTSMRAPHVLTLTLILTLLTAGCLGGDETPPSPAAETSTPEADAPPEGGASEALPEGEAPPEPPAPVTRDVSFEGQTGTFLCYFTPATGGCQGEFSPSSQQDLPYQGTPLSFTGTLTWETESPTAQEMQVRILVRNGTQVEWSDSAPMVSGASPLAFEFDLTQFQGRELVVDVGSLREESAGPGRLVASKSQTFRLDGALTSQPDA